MRTRRQGKVEEQDKKEVKATKQPRNASKSPKPESAKKSQPKKQKSQPKVQSNKKSQPKPQSNKKSLPKKTLPKQQVKQKTIPKISRPSPKKKVEPAKQAQPVKQQKKPQPKKYLNKTYDQQSRINRSMHQRIYLLTAERSEAEQWNFFVQGTSGSSYHVDISTSVKCTCTDFRIKQKPCKHIYFIVTQVAQNNQILDYFNNSKKISKTAYKVLDDQLLDRLRSRLAKPDEKDKKDIDLKDDTDCTVCFTEMNKDTQTLEDCPTCKKYFHFQCITAWKKHNPTCPLCRGALKGGNNVHDRLGLLQNVNIIMSQI